jgi:catalase
MNSAGQWQQQPDFREPMLSLEGAAGHWDHRDDDDYYSQPGAQFRLMSQAQRQALFDNRHAFSEARRGRCRNVMFSIAQGPMPRMARAWRPHSALWRRP